MSNNIKKELELIQGEIRDANDLIRNAMITLTNASTRMVKLVTAAGMECPVVAQSKVRVRRVETHNVGEHIPVKPKGASFSTHEWLRCNYENAPGFTVENAAADAAFIGLSYTRKSLMLACNGLKQRGTLEVVIPYNKQNGTQTVYKFAKATKKK